MNALSFFDNIIEEKLLHLHTAFLAKVLDFDEEELKADIQPLCLTKQYGKSAVKQAVIKNVIYTEQVRPTEKKHAVGKTVLCICCERNIGNTKNGDYELPVIGHHELHSCIIIATI